MEPASVAAGVARARLIERLLADWLRPQREAARTVAVRRFERPPGKDYGESGVMVRTRRRSAFGAGAAAHVPLLGAT